MSPDIHGRMLAREPRDWQSVLHCCPIGAPAGKARWLNGCRAASSPPIWLGWSIGENSAWPFGPERFIAVPTGIGGCSLVILIPIGYSSGMSLIFPQVNRSPTLRSEPFSSQLATDRRNKNSCA